MPEPWISPQQCLKRLANLLGGKSPDEMAAKYLEDAEQAVRLACEEIRSILRLRGWSSASIEAWDARIPHATSLATFHAAIMAVGLGDYNLDAVRELDIRQYLREAPELSVAGEPVAPDADSVIGGIGHGRLTAADTSRCADDIRRVFG